MTLVRGWVSGQYPNDGLLLMLADESFSPCTTVMNCNYWAHASDDWTDPSQRPELTIVLECANDKCINRLPLSLDDYHDVRKVPTHFVVKPGHVFHERVICAHVRRPDPPHEHGADRRVERGRTAGPDLAGPHRHRPGARVCDIRTCSAKSSCKGFSRGPANSGIRSP